jgi:hypothetical protein
MYIYTVYIYIQKTELRENDNFRLFAANGKWKQKTEASFSRSENDKQYLTFAVSANVSSMQKWYITKQYSYGMSILGSIYHLLCCRWQRVNC